MVSSGAICFTSGISCLISSIDVVSGFISETSPTCSVGEDSWGSALVSSVCFTVASVRSSGTFECVGVSSVCFAIGVVSDNSVVVSSGCVTLSIGTPASGILCSAVSTSVTASVDVSSMGAASSVSSITASSVVPTWIRTSDDSPPGTSLACVNSISICDDSLVAVCFDILSSTCVTSFEGVSITSISICSVTF